MAFIDKCKILIKAGNGGDGIVSWRREAHVPLGGPAGGDGGNGGSIYFVGDHNETSLDTLEYTKKIIASSGEKGGIKNMHGANAKDLYIKVPLGTTVYNINSMHYVADIIVDNKPYLIALGGKGGYGNAHFKSGYNKAPTLYEKGEKGEEFEALVELKQLADIGLIGLPNAGKSSLISKLTHANPKIANYQFTTLTPILGAFDYDQQKIIIADIPGLISGASEGIGLGHEFLKHIERCKILIHVVSLSSDDNDDITKNVNTIFDELKKYNQKLINKKIIIVANKLDCINADKNLEKLKQNFSNYEIYPISCLDNTNLSELREVIKKIYDEYKFINQKNEELINNWEFKTNKDESLSKLVKISKIYDHCYDVKCDYLEYWSYRIPINTNDNLIRFNQKLNTVNLNEQLKLAGAINGDTINIYGVELTYEE